VEKDGMTWAPRKQNASETLAVRGKNHIIT